MPQTIFEIILTIFYTLAGIQLLYWLYFLIGLLRTKAVAPEPKGTGVSVVVAARNEIHNLRALIPRVLEQDHEKFELIVVNDRSEDGTLEFLVNLEKNDDRLKALHIHDRPEHINSKKYALTLGIKAASYENILLTDADCMPATTQWISAMDSGFRENKFVLGFSGYTKLKGFLNYFIRYETILTGIQYISSAINGRAYMGVGRNMGYKKSLFLEKKGFLGFQEVLGGDDDLFVNKYATGGNTTVVVGQEALVISTPKLTWKAFLRQKHRHLSVGKHYRTGSKLNIATFNLSWILFYLLLAVVLTQPFDPLIVGFIAGGRILLVLLTFFVSSKRFDYSFGWPGVLILDLIYPFYYIFVGVKAAFIKTITWE